MPDPAAPGTLRPGGRTARIREAVLLAAGDALAADGFDALDLGEIARRAGVGKTTVYRRWGTPGGLAADLLADMAEQSLPRADTAPWRRTSGRTRASSSGRSTTPAKGGSSGR